jgi:hypothetical protein
VRTRVADLGHPPELRRDLGERGEHRGERDVDPHVDRPEELLDLLGGRRDLSEVGNIGADCERFAARFLHVAYRAVQPGLTAGDQADTGAALPEQARGGAPDPGARPGDSDGLGLHVLRLPVSTAPYCR